MKLKPWDLLERTHLVVGSVLFVGTTAGGLAGWISFDAPGWTLPLAALLGCVLGAGGMWWKYRDLPGALVEASQYLSTLEDSLNEAQRILLGNDPPEDKSRGLGQIRDAIFEFILQTVQEARGDRVRAVYFELDPSDPSCLVPVVHRGHSTHVKDLRLKADPRSVAGAAFCDRKAIYVPDAAKDPRVEKTPNGRPIGSIICVSVGGVAGGREPDGVLSVTSNRTNAFKSRDQEFIGVAAALIGLLGFAMSELSTPPSAAGS